ncbi:hypothetical protein ACWT_4705 [Actinoplanes sp. SE50]|uniref:nickel pincer cofactor biosynthesis protein LarC n=1 Tax=unclassified Actinoplanes TaxID=2626549 RepID=UPI00023EBD8D|nr:MULTISPECIES: nickel pincer cofactor biosynthesis protein LarC [unclassified Actinoplanes]AEV85727.1 hypothetical protein ACPL_4836 [Actinoplanes sp. SE50/110]ATO84120.1 hypothetical protein ACWT_4705 [Actinoplanes sp. SE50]SLM01530.1 TIGR00299 family protein [Actinoplanes sp. SE50/110]
MSARHAWVDASAGVAGDMLLGALLDAGADPAVVQAAVDAVVPGSVRISASEVTRAGLRAVKAHVEVLVAEPPHRTWAGLRGMLDDSGLVVAVRDRAVAVFARLAEAEARVHGIPAGDVHFHEVGALDSVADVVGVCAALDDLGVTSVSAGEVAVGSGWVRGAHGQLPVPVPAVAQLALGWRVSAGGSGELATPTGMALLRALAATCEELPSMRVEAAGTGAGGRDRAERANVVRVIIGQREEADRAEGMLGEADRAEGKLGEADRAEGKLGEADREKIVLLEANVDDLDPRLWPGVLARLLAAGAADAWLTPILMKKGRPAHVLSALCAPDQVPGLRRHLFEQTSTLGIRESVRHRTVLARHVVRIGEIAVKIGHLDGVIVQAMPEFEDVAAVARREGRPERVVLQEALAAAAAAGLVPGRPSPPTPPAAPGSPRTSDHHDRGRPG